MKQFIENGLNWLLLKLFKKKQPEMFNFSLYSRLGNNMFCCVCVALFSFVSGLDFYCFLITTFYHYLMVKHVKLKSHPPRQV